jgi:hypothetical protein
LQIFEKFIKIKEEFLDSNKVKTQNTCPHIRRKYDLDWHDDCQSAQNIITRRDITSCKREEKKFGIENYLRLTNT